VRDALGWKSLRELGRFSFPKAPSFFVRADEPESHHPRSEGGLWGGKGLAERRRFRLLCQKVLSRLAGDEGRTYVVDGLADGEDPMRRLLSLSCALLALAGAGCQDGPLGPDMQPQLLIGQSLLSPIRLVPNDDPLLPPLLEVPVTVNRGITGIAIEDKFVIRLTAEFKTAGGNLSIGPQDTDVVGQKDADVRQGSDVAIGACIEIPAETWNAIKDLIDVPVDAVAELVMSTGAGSEKILDSVTLSGIIDPKGSG
jgi:hypothetical protein